MCIPALSLAIAPILAGSLKFSMIGSARTRGPIFVTCSWDPQCNSSKLLTSVSTISVGPQSKFGEGIDIPEGDPFDLTNEGERSKLGGSLLSRLLEGS